MMSKEQFLLNKLAEEASEIVQIALKTAQFGMNEKHPEKTETNRERIFAELNDLLAVVDELNEFHDFGFEPNWLAKVGKRQRMIEYMEYSQMLGKVEPYDNQFMYKPPISHLDIQYVAVGDNENNKVTISINGSGSGGNIPDHIEKD